MLGPNSKNEHSFLLFPAKGEIHGSLWDFCSGAQPSHDFPRAVFLHSPWMCVHALDGQPAPRLPDPTRTAMRGNSPRPPRFPLWMQILAIDCFPSTLLQRKKSLILTDLYLDSLSFFFLFI